MPQLPFLARGLRIVLKGTYGDCVWNNVLHAQGALGPGTETDLDNIAVQVDNLWGTNIAPVVNSGCVLTGVTVWDISSDTGLVGQAETSHAGTRAGTAALTAQTCVGTTWTIRRHYRGGHPRTYMLGIYHSDLVTNSQKFITTAYAQIVQSAWEAFMIGVNAITTPTTGLLTMGQVSYYHGKNADGTPALRVQPVFDPFLGVTVDQRIDSQRRRVGHDQPSIAF